MAVKTLTTENSILGRQAIHVPARWRTAAFNTVVPTLDVVALAVAGAVVPVGTFEAIAYGALVVAVLRCSGFYRTRISPRVTDELPGVVARVALPVVPLGVWLADSPKLPHLIKLAALAAALLVAARVLSYATLRQLRARGHLLEPTLIIGAGQLGQQVAETLHDHPEYGLVPVGFLDGFDDTDLLLPVLDDVGDLDTVLEEFDVRRVIVAFGSHREASMIRVLRACGHHHVEVHVLPRFYELGVTPSSRDTDDVWGIPLLRVKRSALRSSSWRLKRLFDVVFASVALLLSFPVLVACALAVRCSSRGPVLFRQKRVGQRGHLFEVLKFRTLKVADDSDTTWYESDGDRATAVGSFLRRTSLDELPQLINVLRGDMSIVGPRPERPHFVDKFGSAVVRYDDRHRVPVGMTGWAQVHGLRGDTSIEERARFDNHYVEHWSLWLDLVIVGRTVGAVVRDVFKPGR